MKIQERFRYLFSPDYFLYPYIVILAIFLSIRLYRIQFPGGFSDDHARWAEFGSYFGGVIGATSAVLAFFILLKTLNVNQKELSETRRVIEKQNFESSFMQLLNQTDKEYSKINIVVREESLRELRVSIIQFIRSNKQDKTKLSRSIIKKIITHSPIYYQTKPYVDFLKIYLEFIDENLNHRTASQVHVKLFASKLSDEFLLYLIASILYEGKEGSLYTALFRCDIFRFIDHEPTRNDIKHLANYIQ